MNDYIGSQTIWPKTYLHWPRPYNHWPVVYSGLPEDDAIYIVKFENRFMDVEERRNIEVKE